MALLQQCIKSFALSMSHSYLSRPFGFLEAFDPGYTPNTTDEMGRRYTFQQQPTIGQSNLAQLAQAFLIGELVDQVLHLFFMCWCKIYVPTPHTADVEVALRIASLPFWVHG